MKAIYKLIFAAALILGFSACQREEIAEPVKNNGGYELVNGMARIVLTTGEQTKTSMATDGSILWTAGDDIAVFVNGKAYDFQLQSGAGTTSASFVGLVDPADLEATGLQAAAYPYDEDMTYEGGQIQGLTIPSRQYFYYDGSFWDYTLPMAGSITGTTITFVNAAAVLRIILDDPNLGTLEHLYLSETNANYQIDLDCTYKTATVTAEGLDFYFVVPAGGQEYVVSNGTEEIGTYRTSEPVVAGGRYILYDSSLVCKIGQTGYASLKAAIAAAQEDDTIVLLSDITVYDADIIGNTNNDYIYNIAKNISINGANHTIFAEFSSSKVGKADGVHMFRVGASTVTFTDLKIAATAANQGTVKDGVNAINNSTVVLNNCDIRTSDNDHSNANWNIAAVVVNSSNVTINGGTYVGGKAGDYQGVNVDGDNTQLTVASGTTNGIKIESATANVAISGGTHSEIGVSAVAGATVLITGGLYANDVTAFCAPGYKAQLQAAGAMYEIVEIPAVAKIGDTPYYTLADAIAAVGTDGTIKLASDISGASGISVPSGKSFTLDFDGHSYVLGGDGAGSAGTTTIGFQFLQDSNVTLKNGTISCSSANASRTWASGDTEKGIAMIIQNYADLTLQDMTIDGTNIAHNGNNVRYILSNNCGNVEYKGATSIIAPAGDVAFDVCKYEPYTAPTVTWNSTGTLTGAVELTGGEFVVAKALVLSDHIYAEGTAALTVNAAITPASGYAKDYLVGVKRGAKLTASGTGSIDVNNASNVYSPFKMTVKNEPANGNVAELIVTGGTYTGTYYTISGNGSRHDTKVTITGGTFNAPDGYCIYQPQDGELTISGGTFNGYSCIGVKGGSLEITDGTFHASGAKRDYVANGNGIEETGSCIVVDNCDYPAGSPVVDITGGTYTSDHNSAFASYFGGAQTAALASFVDCSLVTVNEAEETASAIYRNIPTWVRVGVEPTDWSGKYLLVYEASKTEGYCWTGVDAGQCYVSATISEDEIIEKPAGAVSLTIASISGGYSIMVNGGDNNGKYIGRSATSNGLNFNNVELLNTIEFSNNSAVITASGGCLMRFNKASGTSNERFRYYGSGQEPVQLYKLGGQHAPAPAKYSISIDENISHGKVSSSVSTAVAGETITLSAMPDKGYTFSSWEVFANEQEISVIDNKFTMPSSNVNVSAIFVEKPLTGVTKTLIIDGKSLTSTASSSEEDYDYGGFTITMSDGAKSQSSLGEYRFTDEAILIGKSGKYVYNNTPIPGEMTGFEIYANKGASAKVTVGVKFSASPITEPPGDYSYSATLSNPDSVYDCSDKLPENAHYFWYQVTNANNSQVQFKITYRVNE